MSVRALIFDLDGLILDTETPARQAWVEAMGRHVSFTVGIWT